VRTAPIYVEVLIRASLDDVWNATQQPELHQRWDARFGSITYLPLEDGRPQQFTYSTKLAPGCTVSGTGESLGDRDRPDGSRWSGLKFWADDWHSVLAAGAGYWRYVPTESGVRFITRYDYRTRWGCVGRVVDRWLFRPVFGWATAWSFDRLRLWVENGSSPERSRNRAVGHAVTSGGLLATALSALSSLASGRRISPRLAAFGVTLATVVVATHSQRPSGRVPLRHPPDSQPEVGPLP
jgi:hypothetical protein